MKDLAASLSLLLAASCASAPPVTHYYQFELAGAPAPPPARAPLLHVEPLAVGAAYATDRMVYRRSRHRLDYYHYHRWSAPLPLLLSEFLREAYFATGRFRRVVLEGAPEQSVTLSGRVSALEEVDISESRWLARLALELVLRDANGVVLWSQSFREEEPLGEQSPNGLARALSRALERVVQRSLEPILEACAAAEAHDHNVELAPRTVPH